jgi:hypothetical protein
MARRRSLADQLAARNSESESDPRLSQALDERSEMAGLRDDARAALPGRDEATVAAVTRDLARLGTLAKAIRRDMIDMGRALLRLQRTVGEGGYKALFRAGLVPVPENRASQLRAVAAAVEAGLIPLDRLPRALEPAYTAARLPAEKVTRLLADGTLRPEATVRELREAAGPPERERAGGMPLAERRRLERRLAWHEAEAERIRERLARA